MEFPTWTHGPTTRNRRSMLHLSLSSGRASSRSSMKALLYFITWNSLYRRKSLIKIRSHQWLIVWLLTQLDDSQDSVMSFIRNSASVYFFKSISNRGKLCKKTLFVSHCSKYCQFGNHFSKYKCKMKAIPIGKLFVYDQIFLNVVSKVFQPLFISFWK